MYELVDTPLINVSIDNDIVQYKFIEKLRVNGKCKYIYIYKLVNIIEESEEIPLTIVVK